MGIIGVIAVVTLMRLVLWLASVSRHRGSIELNSPLAEHDQLGGVDHSTNDDNHGYNDGNYGNNYEDDKPLYP